MSLLQEEMKSRVQKKAYDIRAVICILIPCSNRVRHDLVNAGQVKGLKLLLVNKVYYVYALIMN